MLGNTNSVTTNQWPVADDKLIAQAVITVPVQVNGKLRGTLTVNPDSSKASVIKQAKNVDNVSKHLEGTSILKTIYIKNRLVNFVTKSK